MKALAQTYGPVYVLMQDNAVVQHGQALVSSTPHQPPKTKRLTAKLHQPLEMVCYKCNCVLKQHTL